MKALIIYQDFASATKVNAALQCSIQHLDVRMEWDIRPWRVDMLKFPLTAEEVLEDAADTHLIVLVGCCVGSLRLWLQLWLEHWAKCRQIQNAGLAVLSGENDTTLSVSIIHQLSQFAERRGLTFIIDNSSAVERATKCSARSVPAEEARPPLTQPRFADVTINHSYRHFGINE